MFLVPRSVYFSIRRNLTDPDKLNKLDQLNGNTNYIENAIQYGKRYNIWRNPDIAVQTEEEEPETDMSRQSTAPSHSTAETSPPPPPPPPLLNQQRVEEPMIEESAIEESAIEESTPIRQNERDDYNRARMAVYQALMKLDEKARLACPFCGGSRAYRSTRFFARHMLKDHGYEMSGVEEKLAQETLKKAVGLDRREKTGRRKIYLDADFLADHGMDVIREEPVVPDREPPAAERVVEKRKKPAFRFEGKKLTKEPLVRLKRLPALEKFVKKKKADDKKLVTSAGLKKAISETHNMSPVVKLRKINLSKVSRKKKKVVTNNNKKLSSAIASDDDEMRGVDNKLEMRPVVRMKKLHVPWLHGGKKVKVPKKISTLTSKRQRKVNDALPKKKELKKNKKMNTIQPDKMDEDVATASKRSRASLEEEDEKLRVQPQVRLIRLNVNPLLQRRRKYSKQSLNRKEFSEVRGPKRRKVVPYNPRFDEKLLKMTPRITLPRLKIKPNPVYKTYPKLK